MQKTLPLLCALLLAGALSGPAARAADYTNSIGMKFNNIPAGLAPVTPQSYRVHLHAARVLEATTDPDRKTELEKALLSKEQQAALARTKPYTDFNDLATQSRLGREGVERPIRATVNKAVAEVKQKQQQGQQQAHKQQQRRTRRAVHI